VSHIAKTTILAALAVTTLATGCKPQKGTANPEDYYPLIQVALEGGQIAAMIGRNEAIKDENFAGCVASDVLSSAFDSTGEALAGQLTGDAVIPGFDLDLAECMELPHKDAKSSDDAAVLVEAVAGVTMSAVKHYATKVQAVDCKKGTAALSAVNYVAGMIPAIASEIAEPDGDFKVEAVAIDFSSCEE
jgi:hypothetical protein